MRSLEIMPAGQAGHRFETLYRARSKEFVPLTEVEGDYVAPAARDTYFQNEPNLIAPFDFDYEPRQPRWPWQAL